MTLNESSTDRILRALAGLVLVGLTLFGVTAGVFGWILVALGAILLVTSALGFCPIYAALGIRTCTDCGKSRA